MSSTYPWNNKHLAARCIDKKLDNLCISKLEEKPWLRISFSALTKVEKVQVFNRKHPKYAGRVKGAEVTLWKEGNKEKECGVITYIAVATFPSQSYLIDCSSDQLSDSVQIQLPETKYLNLMEVFVLTKTPPDRTSLCSTTKANVTDCQMLPGGLKEGDVITILMFYGDEHNFMVWLDEDINNRLMLLSYQYTSQQFFMNSKRDGDNEHEEDIESGDSLLLENNMLVIKINVTTHKEPLQSHRE